MNVRTLEVTAAHRGNHAPADGGRSGDSVAGAVYAAMCGAWRNVWRALARKRGADRRRPGRLSEIDDRMLRDLGYLRGDVLAAATRRTAADGAARYRSAL